MSETVSPDAVLQAICSGISQGLGFGRVLVQLRQEGSDQLVVSAGAGLDVGGARTRFALSDADLEHLLDPAFETEGCYCCRSKRRSWASRRTTTPSRRSTTATSALESSAQCEAMRHLADHDPLTKLLNRRAFVRRLEQAALRARESDQPLSLVYCDLDGFKAVNDTHGHADRDRVLRAFADVLVSTVRHDDAVFRVGGDEFALLLERCPRERAVAVVDRVLERLAEERERRGLRVGASFGVAVADCIGPVDADELLRRADDAMYDAKGTRSVLRVAA